MRDKINEIVNKFDCRLIRSIPINKNQVVHTDKGIFYLKKINYSITQVLFIHDVKENLVRKGFKNLDRYMVFNKRPYIQYHKNYYVMTRWVKGEKCNYNDVDELKQAAACLAKFHELTRGIISFASGELESDIGKLQKVYLDRCEDFLYIKSLIKMRDVKSNIDNLLLNNIDLLYDMGIESVKMLQKNGYFDLCRKEAAVRALCHGEYNYKNIILDENREFNIIKFDNCRFGLRCYDIACLIVSALDKLNWDFQKALIILEEYNSVRKLWEIEYKIIFSFIQFPQDIWEIATRYYYDEYDLFKDKYYKLLKSKIEKLPYKINFLYKYKEKFI
ncbi:CotS family spore coat protein [Maledivibacter halophilus]|uniref:Spore coat protein, CotS family n=1 Tax=Maledivibacter halophilus TaxID=36842 RepID=A0A1T5K5E5_9FIRM|nr:CotS family spore coat protein [Maledivibacter halophilus]SKC58755.1 spore coat protein, CotS family [Maledivibacter halophilus]